VASGSPPVIPDSDLNITFSVFSYEGTSCRRLTSLEEQKLEDNVDFMQKCIDSAQAVFPFSIAVTENNAPSLRAAKTAAVTTQTQHTLSGFLLYCPYVNGRESRPPKRGDRRNVVRALVVAGGGSATAAATAMEVEDDDNSKVEEESVANSVPDENPVAETDKDFNIVQCFWQSRLLPESHLQTLPFFPVTSTTLPSNWKGRVVGCLFFDRQFTRISNNKLKITLPDFNRWINERCAQERANIVYLPRGLENRAGGPFIR
jgi:hypothetical protein